MYKFNDIDLDIRGCDEVPLALDNVLDAKLDDLHTRFSFAIPTSRDAFSDADSIALLNADNLHKFKGNNGYEIAPTGERSWESSKGSSKSGTLKRRWIRRGMKWSFPVSRTCIHHIFYPRIWSTFAIMSV